AFLVRMATVTLWRGGTTIAGRFLIEGRLAAGGVAEIFVAQMTLSRGMKRRGAIQPVHPHLAPDPQFGSNFLSVARVSTQLAHPGIVPVLDAVEHEGELFMVLEYVPGWDLGSILKQASEKGLLMPIGAAVWVGEAVAGTLSYVHDARDAKSKSLAIVH